jgi:hypothetical protein
LLALLLEGVASCAIAEAAADEDDEDDDDDDDDEDILFQNQYGDLCFYCLCEHI